MINKFSAVHIDRDAQYLGISFEQFVDTVKVRGWAHEGLDMIEICLAGLIFLRHLKRASV